MSNSSEAGKENERKESKEKGSEIERLDGLKRKLEEEAEKLRASLQQTKVEKENSDRKCEQLQQELDSVRKAAEDAKTTLQDQLKDVKADFERTLQGMPYVKGPLNSQYVLRKLDVCAMGMQPLVKTTVEQKTEWLEKRVAQSDAELESLKEELSRTKQLAANEYSSMREKEEKLLALTIEDNELKTVLKSVNGEKESLERRLEEAAVDLGKAHELEGATVQRAKVAEDVANGKAVELEQRIYALEGELLKAKESKEVLTKELAAAARGNAYLEGAA
ncbi:unnamed protein product [Toxocara canis]|uniref:CAP-Gly domain-containing linker protein 1-like n=1 Tax=Toxocara canis TaxID=6265 RepID=A0A183U2T5_TOXCA|nr:unnamed protein product [Toxocara canis]